MSAATELASSIGQLEVDGYLVLDGFLTSTRCAVIEDSLQRMINEDLSRGLRDFRDSYMVHNPMFRDPIFYGVLMDSILTHILKEFLGEHFILYAYTTSSLPANGTNWSRRIHVDCPRLIPNYPTNMNAFIPLTDMYVDNGGIELLPRSQWREMPPDDNEFRELSISPKMGAGSLLLFYSRLWHSGGQNKTTRPRHALTMNFCRSFMRQRFDYPRMVPPAQVEGLDEMQRQLLGFNVRVPASMDEYYLSGEERLYKPNQG